MRPVLLTRRTPTEGGADRGSRLLALLLHVYPDDFRREYGEAMEQLVRDERRALGSAPRAEVARFWARVALDVLRTLPREHLDDLRARWRAAWERRRPAPRQHQPRATHPSTSEAPVLVAALNILVALLLGFGALEEMIVRGIHGGETQPLVIGLVGAAVSVLLAVSGIAYARRWRRGRVLLIAAGLFLIDFHGYAALPPHRNVGILALIVGVVYGLFLVTLALRPPTTRNVAPPGVPAA